MSERQPQRRAAIDALDRRLIAATQEGLPLTPRPYQALAEALGIPAETVMARLRAMLERGVIRRLGVVPNHYALGFRVNAMTVWDVPDEQVTALGRRVGALDCVTHCYRRPRHPPLWPYNLFAMVHGRGRDEVSGRVEAIAAVLGDAVRASDVLFSRRLLKKAGLRIDHDQAPPGREMPALTPEIRRGRG